MTYINGTIEIGNRLGNMIFAVLTLSAGLLGPAPLALADDLPDAAAVFDKAIDAAGGEGAIAKLTSCITKGTLKIESLGMEGAFTSYTKSPDKYCTKMTIEALGAETQRGTDGKTAYDVNPMSGNRILEGKEKLQLLRDADLHAELNWRKYYENPKCVAVEAFAGENCYKIVADQPADEPVTLYFAKDSGLEVGREVVTENGPAKMLFSDYREIEGVKRPHLTTISTGLADIESRVESMEFNTSIPDEQFVLPDEIMALQKLDKPAEEPTSSGAPTDVTGAWNFEAETSGGTASSTITFKQDGGNLTGQYQGMFGEATVTGRLDGNDIKFSYEVDALGEKVTISYRGTVEADAMKGELELGENGKHGTGTFVGKRQGAAETFAAPEDYPDTPFRNLPLPDVRITSISHNSMTGEDDAASVTYYDVDGVIGGTIGFELLLPDDWNGRFVMGGGGGFVGTVQNAMRGSVKQGYATAGTDTGHRGWGGEFALDDALAQVNFGHVAVHRTAEVAKAIIRAHYGDRPKFSYFLGCSRGGGQAMMESQRYPEDFDGIVAGAPAFDWTGLGSLFLRITQAFYPNPDVLDKTVLTKEEVQRFTDEILQRFDDRDGLKDGIISDPASIQVDLSDIAWLSDAQREAVATIYEELRNQNGQIAPGYPVSSEIEWFVWLVGPTSSKSPTQAYGFSVDLFKYFVFNDPDWDYSKYDFSTWAEDTRLTASTLDAVDTDLSEFREHGGKLIIWHGWADAALTANATVNYYKDLLEEDTTADDFTRLYLIPGCGHCGGGPGVSDVDWLSVISDWVEKDEAPDVIIASRSALSDKPSMKRPLSPYPKLTVYKGRGNPNKAKSFKSVQP